ncbi:MAG: hypothetical protein ACTSX8_02355 [Alphaproteobacteria bacterium]
MSFGDPAFGRTFDAMRSELVREWVYERRSVWWCSKCKKTWCPLDANRYAAQHHAADCLLGPTPRKALPAPRKSERVQQQLFLRVEKVVKSLSGWYGDAQAQLWRIQTSSDPNFVCYVKEDHRHLAEMILIDCKTKGPNFVCQVCQNLFLGEGYSADDGENYECCLECLESLEAATKRALDPPLSPRNQYAHLLPSDELAPPKWPREIESDQAQSPSLAKDE